ncbi:Xaa-Pro dipeptidyl-peptidase [Salicibibacter halophilus]|uniref:Xaa-Pro dipeptidyl-peptidase n=1 Tax=Salicibibacter halophilus TaxID=2502791 RepID=A0A514LKY2_9BACI|nr:Xaa-Pro dipeptidyl-peptidase [Salicibibacter halophilus]QDI92195.1 Xaa-Pro dipeptidyl-peptidase [Salicibibacter halophilus]
MKKRWFKKCTGIAFALAFASSSLFFVEVSAEQATTDEGMTHLIEDGVTQPNFSYEDAIRETVYVDTDLDTNGDGTNDQIAADIIRPAESDEDLDVPVIMIASPYNEEMGRGEESELKEYENGEPVKFPLYYDNYFVPRGYAVMHVDMVGTSLSDGCPTTGGFEETDSVTAVIDWLNGEADASNDEGTEVEADWSSGKVGMYGKSYDGTLANAAAATGVEGLETIVPVTAISSWYDYYRSNGALYHYNGPNGLANTVVNSEREEECQPVFEQMADDMDDDSGDFNDFWDERSYLDDAGNISASVFLIHGLNDLNVKTNHFGQWWEELEANDVERKIWLTQTGHTEPFDFRRDEWVNTIHQWFDHELLDIDNGILEEPMADVETAANEWETYDSWPDQEASTVDLRISPGDDERPGILTDAPVQEGETLDFTNDPQSEDELAAEPFEEDDHRLMFLSPELEEEVRFSGTPEVDIRATVDGEAANLTAFIVDYGTDERVDHQSGSGGMNMLDESDCWGESTDRDSACYQQHEILTHEQDYEIVSRGWMDAQNHDTVWESNPLTPGEQYDFRWDTMTHDYVFKPGHRIGVVIAGSNTSHTVPNEDEIDIEVDLAESHIELPIVGGEQAIDFGLSASGIQEVVQEFDENGEIESEEAVHALDLHLTSVSHYEEQEDTEKVNDHTRGFKDLLNQQLDQDHVTVEAHNHLMEHADALLEKWE